MAKRISCLISVYADGSTSRPEGDKWLEVYNLITWGDDADFCKAVYSPQIWTLCNRQGYGPSSFIKE